MIIDKSVFRSLTQEELDGMAEREAGKAFKVNKDINIERDLDGFEIIDVEDGDNNMADLLYRPKISLSVATQQGVGMVVRVTKHFRTRLETADKVMLYDPDVKEALEWVGEALQKHNMTES